MKRETLQLIPIEIKFIRDYYEWYYTNKLDNLEEMGDFLETYNLSRQSQEEIETMNRPIIKKIKSVIKTSQQEKPRARWFNWWFYQTFKEWMPIFKLSQKLKRTEHFQTGQHFSDPKVRKDSTNKSLLHTMGSILNEHWCQNPWENSGIMSTTAH